MSGTTALRLARGEQATRLRTLRAMLRDASELAQVKLAGILARRLDAERNYARLMPREG